MWDLVGDRPSRRSGGVWGNRGVRSKSGIDRKQRPKQEFYRKAVSESFSVSIAFAGSGTAGHLYPGVRIAEDLVAAGLLDPAGVVFFGGERGSGREAVEAAGFQYRSLKGAAPVRGRSPKGTIGGLVGASRSFVEALVSLRDLGPRAVVGIGGYASFPLLLAGAFSGIPVTVLQVDAVFGLANGLGVNLTRLVPTAFPASRRTFEMSRLGRAALRRGVTPVLVKPCVRPEIEKLAESRNPPLTRKHIGLAPATPLVGFVGGSLGAGPTNEAAWEAFCRWGAVSSPLTAGVIQVTGQRYFDECVQRIMEASRYRSGQGCDHGRAGGKGSVSENPEAAKELARNLAEALGISPGTVFVARLQPCFIVVPYVSRMDRLYGACDLVVARAGAVTVGELAASGTPGVLLPSSFVPADHQRSNAEALARLGGAVIVHDSQCRLVPSVVERLLDSPQKLSKMRKAGLQAAAVPRAAFEVVAEVAGLTSARPVSVLST
ncbi:MAG: hypothetical protein C4319_02890 [Acidimicrobiia bacterium]